MCLTIMVGKKSKPYHEQNERAVEEKGPILGSLVRKST